MIPEIAEILVVELVECKKLKSRLGVTSDLCTHSGYLHTIEACHGFLDSL